MTTIEEIDEYCSLCMDINCTGCDYHDVHFRNIKKKITMATIKDNCFSCDWYNPRHIDSNMPKCDKLRKPTDPYNPICNNGND